MGKDRYRLSFKPCDFCGYVTEEKEGRENGTWCDEPAVHKKWLCGKCQIGYCVPKGIIDSIDIDEYRKSKEAK